MAIVQNVKETPGDSLDVLRKRGSFVGCRVGRLTHCRPLPMGGGSAADNLRLLGNTAAGGGIDAVVEPHMTPGMHLQNSIRLGCPSRGVRRCQAEPGRAGASRDLSLALKTSLHTAQMSGDMLLALRRARKLKGARIRRTQKRKTVYNLCAGVQSSFPRGFARFEAGEIDPGHTFCAIRRLKAQEAILYHYNTI